MLHSEPVAALSHAARPELCKKDSTRYIAAYLQEPMYELVFRVAQSTQEERKENAWTAE
jgi:hypothetical protein